MKTLPLSVVIIACNEERILGQTLSAVSNLASEIIVVDSGSTDKTIEIAKKYNAQCHYQQWLGYSAQKNFALSLATKDWILSLDADEVVSDELAEEIRNILSEYETDILSKNRCDGYRVPRLLYIGNTPLKHGGFYPDAQLRLFKKGKGKFIERKVHESVQVEGSVGELHSALLHYSYMDLSHFESTLDRYAKLSAEEFLRRGNSYPWRASILNEAIHPIWTFIYRYFFRAGFMDGPIGLKANVIYKKYVQKKIKYLRELLKAEDK